MSGSLTAYFSDRGTIRTATSVGTAGDWELSGVITLTGDSETSYLSAPALSNLDQQLLLFHDVRSDVDALAAIGVARMGDTGYYEFDPNPSLVPENASHSFEDPFVLNEDGLLRMWFSWWDGETWSIAYSESFDATSWSEPQTVASIPDGHIAAPVVAYVNGRYRLWATISEDGETWSHATAWSITGDEWSDITPQLDANDAFALAHPPRTAVQVEATGAWRIDARDLGPMMADASAGDTTSSGGFSFTVANGHSMPTGLLDDDRSINGLEPGAYLELDGVPTLYVTGIGDDTLSHIGALQYRDGEWQDTGARVVSHTNASHPVVTEDGTGWRLYYAASGDDGRTRIYSAYSDDGLTFSRDLDDPVQSGESWDDLGQFPHSIQTFDDGSQWLWYTGDNGSRQRIGAAQTTDGRTFTVQTGLEQDYIFGPGEPGTFDDSGVKHPYVFTQDGQTKMLYAGFDGSVWHLGYAERTEQGAWVRRQNDYLGEGIPAMSGVSGSFSIGGVQSPVVVPGGDHLQVYYSGFDGFKHRIGYAEGRDRLYPIQRVPTLGDTLVFETTRGDEESSVIEPRPERRRLLHRRHRNKRPDHR